METTTTWADELDDEEEDEEDEDAAASDRPDPPLPPSELQACEYAPRFHLADEHRLLRLWRDGEGGIRTLERGFPRYAISSRARSTAPAPLLCSPMRWALGGGTA